MRNLISILSLAICLGCQEEAYVYKDLCPFCIATIKLNGEDWPCKPVFTRFQMEGQDTFFSVAIAEEMPLHDKFNDELLLSNIPVVVGVYKFNPTLSQLNRIRAKIFVFEPNGGETPVDFYNSIYDSTSLINVEYINIINDSFNISFELVLHPQGIADGPINNTTYPEIINITGTASGVIID